MGWGDWVGSRRPCHSDKMSPGHLRRLGLSFPFGACLEEKIPEVPTLGWPGMLAQPLRAALRGLSLGFLIQATWGRVSSSASLEMDVGRAQRQGPCEGPVRGGGLRPSPLLWGWTLGPGLGCVWEVRGVWAVAEGGLGVPGVPWTWAQLGHSLLSCDPGRGSCSGQAPGCGAGQKWPSHPDVPRSTCPWTPKLPGTVLPGSCKRRGQLGSPSPWWV